jgi:hypothetical protein
LASPGPIGKLAVWCYNRPPYVRAGLALVLIGINILIEARFGRNAITHYYAPLLPAVAAAGVLFGPATGLFAPWWRWLRPLSFSLRQRPIFQ